MHRSCFNASVVTLLALVVPACGGSSKPSPDEPLHGEAPPGDPPPEPIKWLVSQTGNGQCLAFDAPEMASERHIYCPEGIDIDGGATVWQRGPDDCTAVLDSCEGECAPVPTPCPDPAGSWDDLDDE